ncbi:MAG: site-specific integrase [Rhodospirillales bacterium]|nr:site-specific integrase [Rhodospirillales bacterium]
MSGPFKRAVESAGMDPAKVIPHTLQHTAITRFAGSAPDLKTLQAFSGHKSIQALLRYLHEQDKRVDEAMDRMEQARTSGEPAAIPKLLRS